MQKSMQNRLRRWDFCTPESFSHGLRSKCADLAELLQKSIKYQQAERLPSAGPGHAFPVKGRDKAFFGRLALLDKGIFHAKLQGEIHKLFIGSAFYPAVQLR